MRITGNLTLIFVNCGILAVVAAAIYWLQSAWPLLGCMFFMSSSAAQIKTECPGCHMEFTAVAKDDDC
jgi:hypothetical protein